jgi:hypothetical protein
MVEWLESGSVGFGGVVAQNSAVSLCRVCVVLSGRLMKHGGRPVKDRTLVRFIVVTYYNSKAFCR